MNYVDEPLSTVCSLMSNVATCHRRWMCSKEITLAYRSTWKFNFSAVHAPNVIGYSNKSQKGNDRKKKKRKSFNSYLIKLRLLTISIKHQFRMTSWWTSTKTNDELSQVWIEKRNWTTNVEHSVIFTIQVPLPFPHYFSSKTSAFSAYRNDELAVGHWMLQLVDAGANGFIFPQAWRPEESINHPRYDFHFHWSCFFARLLQPSCNSMLRFYTPATSFMSFAPLLMEHVLSDANKHPYNSNRFMLKKNAITPVPFPEQWVLILRIAKKI